MQLRQDITNKLDKDERSGSYRRSNEKLREDAILRRKESEYKNLDSLSQMN